jgi:hypothetical protein
LVVRVVVPVGVVGSGEVVCEAEVVVVVDPVARGFKLEPRVGVLRADERVAVVSIGASSLGIPRDLASVAVLPEEPPGSRRDEVLRVGIRFDVLKVDLVGSIRAGLARSVVARIVVRGFLRRRIIDGRRRVFDAVDHLRMMGLTKTTAMGGVPGRSVAVVEDALLLGRDLGHARSPPRTPSLRESERYNHPKERGL